MIWPRERARQRMQKEVSLTPLPPATRPSRLLLFLKGFLLVLLQSRG